MVFLPPDKMLRLRPQLLIGREIQIPAPVHNLPIRIMRLLGAERRPSNQALEHDRTHAPPVAPEVVPLAAENLRSDVVRRADCGVSELAPGLAPGVDLVAVGDGELDGVEADGVAVLLGEGFRAVWDMSCW